MRRKKFQTGAAILIVVFLLAIMAMIPVGMQLVTISRRDTQHNLKILAQADQVARAGLVDAIAWFKRQPIQPVRSSANPIEYPYPDAAFFPRTSTDPVTSATLDESVGLVKEYSVSEVSWLWARYEIKRQQDPSANPHDPRAVHDLTESSVDGFSAGDGLAWYIESAGYVYRLKDSSLPFNQPPNEIIAISRASTEIRRLAVALPVNAAVIVTDRVNVTVNSNGRITGNNDAGLGYYTGSSGPTISGVGAEVSGTPATIDMDGPASNGSLTPQTIFGVTESDLRLMADWMVTTVTQLPPDYPAMAVVYINGNATFDNSRKLRGGGILYVDGNLTIDSGSNTLFGGAIYVTGNLIINGPTLISGSILCEGSVTLSGSGDVSQVQFDNNILNSVRQQVAQYRENKATTFAFQDR